MISCRMTQSWTQGNEFFIDKQCIQMLQGNSCETINQS